MQQLAGAFVPEVDEAIPLPASVAEAFPSLTMDEEIQMRARTIKFIQDLTGVNPVITPEQQREAEAMARNMITSPAERPKYGTYPDGTMEYLAGLVAAMNYSIVEELSELKSYVVNHLVHTVEHPDSQKNKLAALKLLGEIAGVDAYSRKSEVTVTVKPLEQVEKELGSILESLDHVVVSESTQPVVAPPAITENPVDQAKE